MRGHMWLNKVASVLVPINFVLFLRKKTQEPQKHFKFNLSTVLLTAVKKPLHFWECILKTPTKLELNPKSTNRTLKSFKSNLFHVNIRRIYALVKD